MGTDILCVVVLQTEELQSVKDSRDALQRDFDELMNNIEKYQGADTTEAIDEAKLPDLMKELQAENTRLKV